MQKMKIDCVHCPMKNFWRTSLRPFRQNNVYREHDILFTSPVLDFGPPAIHVHVFLNSRIFRGVKPIFRLCPSLGSSQPSPPELDFGSALFLILLGQVELNPGPPMSGICCDSCDMWFHKDSIDMGHGIFHLPGIFHNKRLVDMLSMQSSKSKF